METATQHENEVDRRRFLAGAALTAGVWVAPSVLTVDRAFGTPGTPMCVNSAYDFTVVTTGPAASTTGPISSCSQSGTDELSTFDITVPTLGMLGSGSAFTAQCSDTAGCSAIAEIASLLIDLTPLTTPTPVTVSATAIRADANCVGGSTTRTVTLASGELVFGMTTFPLDLSPAPNTIVFDDTVGPVQLLVVLNEQTVAGGTVNAIHITLTVTSLVTDPQTVDIVIASATATC